MSDTHPYWAYVAVPGTIDADREQAAVEEGRRAFALGLAARWDDTVEGQLAAARAFEAFLKGEPVQDVNGAPLK